MDGLIRVIAGAMITVILVVFLQKGSKDFGLLLTLCVSCMVLAVSVSYIRPVFELVEKLESLADLNGQWLKIVMKAVGVGLVAQISSLICTDSGTSALGKSIQILSTAAILWLSIPLINGLVDLIQKILGDL